jgi:hypothetical protein
VNFCTTFDRRRRRERPLVLKMLESWFVPPEEFTVRARSSIGRASDS